MSNKNILQTGCLICVILIAGALWWLYRALPRMRVEGNDNIDMTQAQIESIRNIGQWEFLSVSDEELVDTTRQGFFSDDHLVRIYYGTMRLGIDLSQLSEGDISRTGDSIIVILPAISLLDDDFIDETRTKAFHESGRWSAADREAMYERARRQMKSHALTRENIAVAQNNADAQMRQMLKAMGFKKVIIRFKEL